MSDVRTDTIFCISLSKQPLLHHIFGRQSIVKYLNSVNVTEHKTNPVNCQIIKCRERVSIGSWSTLASCLSNFQKIEGFDKRKLTNQSQSNSKLITKHSSKQIVSINFKSTTHCEYCHNRATRKTRDWITTWNGQYLLLPSSSSPVFPPSRVSGKHWFPLSSCLQVALIVDFPWPAV